jgi:DNA-binding HxlR family transcriptional regulator
MKRNIVSKPPSPISRRLKRVGEWWSVLILRDALYGVSRFDQFQKGLGIAPNILSKRLNALVEDGFLARHQYSEKPPRNEYRLTPLGRDFRTVIVALYAWGNQHFFPEGASLLLVDAKSGVVAHPIMVDQESGRPITEADYIFVSGPNASQKMIEHLAFAKSRPGLAQQTTAHDATDPPDERRDT